VEKGAKMVKVREDLTGRVFDRLIVIKQAEDYIDKKGKHYSQWNCICSCGTSTIVRGSDIKKGKTHSCGCFNRDRIIEYNTTVKKKYNDYEVQEDYVIMYTSKNEPFYVDLEDFWKVKDIYWYKDDKGYIKSSNISLHRLIMGNPDGFEVDHIHGHLTRDDNRKENLRLATPSQNTINSRLRSDNASGVTGVYWYPKYNKWAASISINKKQIGLGYFKKFEDAVEARRNAENQYYGEWSYFNSQNL
jgi:hypothetical protein